MAAELREHRSEELRTAAKLHSHVVIPSEGSISIRQCWWTKQTVRVLKTYGRVEVGPSTSCDNNQGEDSVKVFQGHGVGPVWRRMVLGFCGVRMKKKASRPISLRCHSSAVTLVSSGEFYNKVIFSFLPAGQDDVTACWRHQSWHRRPPRWGGSPTYCVEVLITGSWSESYCFWILRLRLTVKGILLDGGRFFICTAKIQI